MEPQNNSLDVRKMGDALYPEKRLGSIFSKAYFEKLRCYLDVARNEILNALIGKKIEMSKLAGIEYHGAPGDTQRCVDALRSVLGAGEQAQTAWILSWSDGKTGEHSILLTVSSCLHILIKPGFRSGYSGTGPTGLATAIELLQLFEVDIEEFDVDEDFHRRCEAGCLLSSDLEKLTQSRPVRPSRYYEYIERPPYRGKADIRHLLVEFPAVLNPGLLDERLIDLSIGFLNNPDSAITTVFRRLEDIDRNPRQEQLPAVHSGIRR